jgi:GTPase SAR1 family protein
VVVETDKDETFIIEVPSSIKHKELRELLENEITKTSHFYFVYKNKRYESGNNKEEVIHINEGTKI